MMDTTPNLEKPASWLDKPVLRPFPEFKFEHLLIAIILLITALSRFYGIGDRAMSHDEINHVVPSYELFQGNGYRHDPITHGPMQFHLLAATYFLFGDTDYASRVPSAIFSFATVVFVLLGFKRYLGRIGAIISGVFFMISPYMLFYGRYTRNESFVALFGVLMLFLVLYYLEKGKKSTLLIFSAILSLQFCTKETAFIYSAILLIFLAFLFFVDVLKKEWSNTNGKSLFTISMIFAFLFAGLALLASVMESKASSETQPFTSELLQNLLPTYHITLFVSLGLMAAALVLAVVFLFNGLGWSSVKKIRSFELLLLTFTLILPLLTAFPVKLIGWDPLDYSQAGLIHTGIILVIMTAIAITIGCIWKTSTWLASAGIFYAIFIILYTTFFTNGQGFFTGIVGSLGYWLSQQGVNRGTQPWYYYAFLQIPMYEYLAAAGLVIALIFGVRHKLFTQTSGKSPYQQRNHEDDVEQSNLPLQTPSDESHPVENPKLPVLALLGFWSVMSLIAYTIAGEKMPWLTVHITLPMLLAAGWGVGFLIESIPWKKVAKSRGFLAISFILIFLISIGTTIGSLFDFVKPFSGTTLEQLQSTSTFLFSFIAMVLSGWGMIHFLSGWRFKNFFKLLLLVFFTILSLLTARSAYQASFINYDNAKEFLVYAHGAAGPKEILKQVEEISERTTGGKDIKVAYIGDALYPYWWYFRDYPNKMWLKDDISRDLLNYPLVISDDVFLAKTQSVLGEDYFQYDYKRLWWPSMDYMNLSWQQVWTGIKTPNMVHAIFNIWLNKDYSLYATVTNNSSLTLETWQPSASLHFFIKKDIVAQIWEYGTSPTIVTTTKVDPYSGKYADLIPDVYFGQSGSETGQFNTAHGIAFGLDGSIYVADSNNNRIQHFSSSGRFIESWGTFASLDNGPAAGGTFNEPWGIAIGPDGSVYVSDTWNYRVQKFTSDGQFITMWGVSGQAETPDAFWGPRGIAVDSKGLVYVTDTGNKRVVIFDSNGNYVSQFGSSGMDAGQFDEPVGISVDKSGLVYVADTWNGRIQVFSPDSAGLSYEVVRTWEVNGWESQSAQNKPFLALDSNGNVFVTDPDNFRVLEFDNNGNFIRGWGQYSSGIDGFGMPVGIAVDSSDHIWVVDSGNNYVFRFSMPEVVPTEITSLPEFPQSSVPLNFDPSSKQLVDSIGQAFYQLDASRNIWVPIIPASIAADFDTQIIPTMDDLGIWYIKDGAGKSLYQWNQGALMWIPIATDSSAQ